MTTGNVACKVFVKRGEALSLEDLRANVYAQAAVPPGEQLIFSAAGGTELREDDALIGGGDDADRAGSANCQWKGDPVAKLLLVRSLRDPRITDLSHFHSKVKFQEPVPGSFTALRRLGKGRRGEKWLYRWDPSVGWPGSGVSRGQPVLARTLDAGALETFRGGQTSEYALYCKHASESRFASQQTKDHEDTLTELGVLAYLAKQADVPVHLMRMIGTFYAKQQNWLVTEYADGGKLLEAVVLNPDAMVSSKKKRRYTWQLLHALKYLHHHHIGHRSVSLGNILLKDGSVRLGNFGGSVRSHTDTGDLFRYFRAVGREPYCAPECHVPSSETACVVARPGSSPGDIVLARVEDTYLCEVRLPQDASPNVPCKAELWGYAATPADIFAAGVCLYMIGMQTAPWRIAAFSDPNFAHLYRKGDAELFGRLQDWIPEGRVEDAELELMGQMFLSHPGERPCASECLESSWFADMAQTPVATHGQSLSPLVRAPGGC